MERVKRSAIHLHSQNKHLLQEYNGVSFENMRMKRGLMLLSMRLKEYEELVVQHFGRGVRKLEGGGADIYCPSFYNDLQFVSPHFVQIGDSNVN